MLQESSPSYWLYWVKASHRSHLIWTGCCFPDWTQSYPLPEMKHKRGQGLPKVTQPQSCLPTWAENTQLFQAAQEVPSLLNNPGGLAGVEVSFGCILVDINTTPTLPSPEFPSCWENGWTQRTTWTGISSSFLLTICRVISEPPLGWCFRSEKTKHIKPLVWPRLGQLPSRGGLSPDRLMYITAVSPLWWQVSNRGCYSCPKMAEHSAPGGLRLDGQSSGLPHNPGSWWGHQWPHSAAAVGEGQSSPKNGEEGFLFWDLKYCWFFFFSRSFTSDSLQPHGLQHARLPVLQHLPESAQIQVHGVGNAIQPSRPLPPLLLLFSVFPSIRVFSSEPVLRIRWPKYPSFSFSISPFNEYSGLISFRIDWSDLLTVQGTLKSSPAPQFESVRTKVE